MHRTLRLLLLLCAALCTAEALHRVADGRLCGDFMPSTDFDHLHAQRYHEFLISAPRGVGSEHYNSSVRMIAREVEALQREAQLRHPEATFDVLRADGAFALSSQTNIVEYVTHFPNVIVNITLVNQSAAAMRSGHLMFSSHIDSHSHTKGAYDDGINCAVMLELLRSVVLSARAVTNNMLFVFCGSEELGLHSSAKLIRELDLRGEVVNMESLGAFRPFGFISQTRGASNMVRHLAKSRGALISTLFTDLYHSPIVLSFSDIDNYEKVNMTGMLSVFFGNPTFYHTTMDMFSNVDDIRYAGNVLRQLIDNYRPPKEEKEDVIGLGISPFVIVVKKEVHQVCVGAVILIAMVYMVLKRKTTFKIMGLLRVVLSIMFVIVCYLALGVVLYRFNSGTYAQHMFVNFVVLSFYGMFSLLFTGILEIDNETIENSSIIIESLLLLLIYKYDISIIFFFIFVFKIIKMLFPCLKYLFGLFYMPMLFFISFSYYFSIGFGNSSKGYIGEIIPFICVIIFILTFAINIIPILNKNTNEFNNGFYLLPMFAIVMYFTFLKPPYSKDYLIVGTVNEDIYENGTGILSFIPAAGKRVSNGISKNYKIENITRFMMNDLGFTKKLDKVNVSSLFDYWPKYTVERIDYKLHFEFRSIPKNTEASLVIIQCGNKKCIEKVDNLTDIKYRKYNDEYIGIVRFIPIISGFSSDIILNTKNKVTINTIFTSPKVTKENSDFRNSLSNYVYNMNRERYICGTVLVNNSMIL